MECNYHSDCSPSDACFDHKCVDPCSLANVCGHGADCSSLNHSAVCTCQPGGTGDPNLGCTPVQYCKSDSQCATGSACNGGICTGKSQSRQSRTKTAKSVQMHYTIFCLCKRSVEVRETASGISFASTVFASLHAEVTQAARNTNTATTTYVFKNYVVPRTATVDTTKNASRITSVR